MSNASEAIVNNEHLQALPIGAKLKNEYIIEKVLGQGGFGITYRAKDISLNKDVAIKEYFPSSLAVRESTSSVRSKSNDHSKDYEWALKKFIFEAQTLARFHHENIVRVYRTFEENNTAYIVLEYVEGQDMEKWLKKKTHLPTQEELDSIVYKLLDALKNIHANNVLHRDIKPTNIYIREDGSPVLLDFGAAHYFTSENTISSVAVASHGYSPYECYVPKDRNQGAWTDIYSLAATIYRALTGNAPPNALLRNSPDPDPYKPLTKVFSGNTSYRKDFLESLDLALKNSHKDRPKSVDQWAKKLLKGRRKSSEPISLITRSEKATSQPKSSSSSSSSTFGTSTSSYSRSSQSKYSSFPSHSSHSSVSWRYGKGRRAIDSVRRLVGWSLAVIALFGGVLLFAANMEVKVAKDIFRQIEVNFFPSNDRSIELQQENAREVERQKLQQEQQRLARERQEQEQKRAAEEAERLRQQQEQQRLARERQEQEQKRAAEEAERLRQQQEQQRLARERQEQEQKRAAEEAERLRQQQEQQRLARERQEQERARAAAEAERLRQERARTQSTRRTPVPQTNPNSGQQNRSSRVRVTRPRVEQRPRQPVQRRTAPRVRRQPPPVIQERRIPRRPSRTFDDRDAFEPVR